MNDSDFDTALVTAAFRLADEKGWRHVNAAAAARAAGLSLAEARERFPSRSAILLRFGRLADQTALADAPSDGPVRDRLFDLLMRRFDVLQAHRAGVRALLRALPTDPGTALLLASATRRSMRWMLQGAGIDATGPRGDLQVQGLLAVWLWAVRAWDRDDSEDLSGTMASIDTALQRAEQMASWLQGQPPSPSVADGAGELDPSGFSDAERLAAPALALDGAGTLDPGDVPTSGGAQATDPLTPPSTDLGAVKIDPPPPPPVAGGAGELDPSSPPAVGDPSRTRSDP